MFHLAFLRVYSDSRSWSVKSRPLASAAVGWGWRRTTLTRQYPKRPIPAVGVVVWKDERVMLIRRAKPPRQGEWSLPGGVQKVGETISEAAAREVAEETGCSIEMIGLVDIVDSIHRDDKGLVRFHYTLVDVVARWLDGDGVAGGDATDLDWFSIEKLAQLELWAETVRIIKASRRFL